jgi:hypothetical protein
MVAVTAFFILVGLLVLLTEDLELKLVMGVGSILIGVAVALSAMDFPEIAVILVAVLAALVTKEIMEHLSVY